MVTYRVVLVVIVLGFFAVDDSALAQTGSVAGDVLSANGIPVLGAIVRLDVLTPTSLHYEVTTPADGRFAIMDLPEGLCSVLAMRSGLGYGSDLLEVSSGSTTYTALFLTNGEGQGEAPQTVSLAGTARILDPGSEFPQYVLDVGVGGAHEYSLLFGPPWYTPGAGNGSRPIDGQGVHLEVAPFAYSDIPMVVVRSIGGEYWRSAAEGHGAAVGHFQEAAGCTTCTVTRIEADGWLDLITDPAPPDDSIAYRFDWYYNRRIIMLDFGAASYAPPPDGAERPTYSQQIHFVGGQYSSEITGEWRAIVYEIGGAVWRVPGDTVGFGRLTDFAPDPPEFSPGNYNVLENYPNPFNGQTAIHWSIDRTTRGTLDVVDLLGRRVAVIDDGVWTAGQHTRIWTCEACASGVYLLRLQTADQLRTHRVHLIR